MKSDKPVNIPSSPKETAPGLNKRSKSFLYKAIGLDSTKPISPILLHHLANNHPDEKIRKLAAFQLKGIYKP